MILALTGIHMKPNGSCSMKSSWPTNRDLVIAWYHSDGKKTLLLPDGLTLNDTER
jgi:hypothetical protein